MKMMNRKYNINRKMVHIPNVNLLLKSLYKRL